MRTFGVVVAYFSDLKELTSNISSYIDELDILIIWDNTPDQSKDYFQSLKESYKDKIQVMGTGKNEGISYALNRVAEWGIKENYDYLLTMDQDSSFAEGSLAYFMQTIQKANRRDVVMFTSMLRLSSGDDPSFEGDFQEQITGITSGSIMPLDVFEKIGFFNEELFIDGVDIEICWRAKEYQLKVLQVNHVYLKHNFGTLTAHDFLGKKWYATNYSPIRVYYSVRNSIYIYKKYKKKEFIKEVSYNWKHKKAKAIIQLLKEPFKYVYYTLGLERGKDIILLERDKREKIRAIFIGIKHGLKEKLGPYQL
jgi:rhamnosyltransferase